jgi:hypothetical protein
MSSSSAEAMTAGFDSMIHSFSVFVGEGAWRIEAHVSNQAGTLEAEKVAEGER